MFNYEKTRRKNLFERRPKMSIRKRYTGVFKGKVALESVKGEKTLSELASHYEVHPNQIKNWKSYLAHHVGDIFENRIKKKGGISS